MLEILENGLDISLQNAYTARTPWPCVRTANSLPLSGAPRRHFVAKPSRRWEKFVEGGGGRETVLSVNGYGLFSGCETPNWMHINT